MAKVLVVRMREEGAKGQGSFEYKNEIILQDFQKLALLFSDFELHGAKIEKAFREYQRQKQNFPF